MSETDAHEAGGQQRGRRHWLRWLAIGGVAVVVIGGLLFWRATMPPTPGAFYEPPDPLPAGGPGTVIRIEPITANLPEGAVAWRVLYRSTGIDGEPIAVSGLIVAPAGSPPAERPVVAWAQGTVGVRPECGTSHRDDPFEAIPAIDRLIAEGYVVAATDYPGRGTPGTHPYLVGPVAAYAVLDSVRAAAWLEVGAGRHFVIWGASQGGHSTLWAAQWAPEYAPDLTLLGAAASAPAIDLPGIIEAGRTTRGGGIVTSQALYAWSRTFPEADLDRIIVPGERERFERLATTCLTTPAAFLALGEIPTPADFLSTDPLALEPWRTLIETNVPNGPIDVPLLLSHGTADGLIPLAGSEAEAERRCAAGEDVQLARYPGVNHDAAAESALATLGWIGDRFAGRPTGPTCVRS